MSQHAGRFRATTVGVLALTVLVVLAGCANPSSTGSSGSGTREAIGTAAPTAGAPAPARATITATHLFAAYGSNGAPTAGVGARRSGTCFTSSITVAAADAYRCFAGSRILDPCFASSTSKTVHTLACYADPWSKATQLALTAKLPAAAPPLKITRPWGIELANGHRCVAATGTAVIERGVSLSYRCDSGTAGLLSPSARSLQAFYRTPTTLVPVGVVTAWKA